MIKKAIYISIAFFLFCLCLRNLSLAQPLPAQEISGQERSRQIQEEDKSLREKIKKEKKLLDIEDKEKPPKEEPTPIQPTEKVLIKKINVIGVTLLSENEIKEIISTYEEKELSVVDMQRVAGLLSDLYRKKGYITSRAYLPPQRIEEGVLNIRVVEGIMGSCEVKGNRYFKKNLILRYITLKQGMPFNYNRLRKDLVKVNEHPDRSCRAVLVPGKEPGTTDLILEAKDRLPIHVALDWDNFGSRYIDKNRYSVRVMHNNLLGFDDKLTFQYQLAEASRYFLKYIRYLIPCPMDTELGLFAAFSRVKLGKEFEDQDARGKSRLYGVVVNKTLIDEENVDLSANLGFDYKNITNYQNQAVSSEDKLRVLKSGLDLDVTDNSGRTLIFYELDIGLPHIMGGLKSKDPDASRDGAGGKFVKNTFNLLRLQKMPFSSSLLWKNQIQLSPYTLTASEQFQIGGIANVRGYPPAEVVGDRGYSMSLEWTCPVYFLPKDIKVPFSKAKFYDALRLAAFYDWANTRLKRPVGTEQKHRTLRSLGCGMRFNLPEDFSFRVDIAWPLDNTPSDGDHAHTWLQISKSF